MLISFFRIIKFAFQDLWRNVWLSVITVSIMVLALISINFLIVFNAITQIATEIVHERIDVSVYLKSEVSQEQTANIREFLQTMTEVSEVKVVEPQEAMESFLQKHQDNEKIVQSINELDENPLGYTLIVKAKDPSYYQNIMSALDSPQFTDFILDKSYEDHKVMIDKIQKISDKVSKAGITVSLIFILISALIVVNTIRISIYTHREEIGIMRLVGATNWFIRMPFLVESVILSLFALILATSILYPILSLSQPYLETLFETSNYNVIDYFNSNFIKIFGLELLGMILINVLSSSLAIRKYLKV